MLEQANGTLTVEECGLLHGKFLERTRRLRALFELDHVLSTAANRHDLAAKVLHFGWPHSAD